MKTVKRRRKEARTNYTTRLKLLKSGKPRLVFRKTNTRVIAQYIISNDAQDKIILGVDSKKLLKYGWPEDKKGSLKSLPASYLTGYLVAKEIQKKKLETPIVDFGMLRTLAGTKLFAFLKGLVDAGLDIKVKEETFPSEERIMGTHLKEDFSQIFNQVKEKLEKA